MNESGPIRKTYKDLKDVEQFCDLEAIGDNVWRCVRHGKRWLLKTAVSDDAGSYALLRREYEISCQMDHPYIASVVDLIEDSPVGPAMQIEYVEGRTLREFIDGKPSARLRRKVLSELFDAVSYIHHKGIVHNDIKPENIMVSSLGNDVKLIDFGLAENESDYLNKRLGGTRGNTAPEVMSGVFDAKSDARSDIYSLGRIIQALFPHRFLYIAAKCVRFNPERRYPDVEALRSAFTMRRWNFAFAAMALLAMASAWGVREVRDEMASRQALDREEMYRTALDSIGRRVEAENAAVREEMYQAALDSIGRRIEAEKAAEEAAIKAAVEKVRVTLTEYFNEAMAYFDLPTLPERFSSVDDIYYLYISNAAEFKKSLATFEESQMFDKVYVEHIDAIKIKLWEREGW